MKLNNLIGINQLMSNWFKIKINCQQSTVNSLFFYTFPFQEEPILVSLKEPNSKESDSKKNQF